ncbi:MAG: hypothetical protein HC933_17900 [Pleurocapsa sp. SU_196_0]|nr:hypothetical protein [Pleurocapsa sp. SU_196_0]
MTSEPLIKKGELGLESAVHCRNIMIPNLKHLAAAGHVFAPRDPAGIETLLGVEPRRASRLKSFLILECPAPRVSK